MGPGKGTPGEAATILGIKGLEEATEALSLGVGVLDLEVVGFRVVDMFEGFTEGDMFGCFTVSDMHPGKGTPGEAVTIPGIEFRAS